jgi:hypothetical protein
MYIVICNSTQRVEGSCIHCNVQKYTDSGGPYVHCNVQQYTDSGESLCTS